MKCPHCRKEFKDPGRAKGGGISRRKITPRQQSKMQAARKLNRATKKKHEGTCNKRSEAGG